MFRSFLTVMRLACLCLVGLLFAGPAFAEELASRGVLDNPLVGMAVETAVVVLLPIAAGLATMILGRLYAFVGQKQTAENRATIEQVLGRAADFARARYGLGFYPANGLIPSAAMREAAEYALEAGPRALAKVGILHVDSPRLGKMLEARFAERLAQPADIVDAGPRRV